MVKTKLEIISIVEQKTFKGSVFYTRFRIGSEEYFSVTIIDTLPKKIGDVCQYAKGGCRAVFYDRTPVITCGELAAAMTEKLMVSGLFFDELLPLTGAKTLILLPKPEYQSNAEKKIAALKMHGRFLLEQGILLCNQNPNGIYPLAPDLNIGMTEMDLFSEEFGIISATGKSVSKGGIPGKADTTGAGLVLLYNELNSHLKIPNNHAFLQGIGQVGCGVIRTCVREKVDILFRGASDIAGAVIFDDPLSARDIEKHLGCSNVIRALSDEFQVPIFPHESFFDHALTLNPKPALFMPCATGGTVTKRFIDSLAKQKTQQYSSVILSGANLAYEWINGDDLADYAWQRGIFALTPEQVNWGGVVGSHLEMKVGLKLASVPTLADVTDSILIIAKKIAEGVVKSVKNNISPAEHQVRLIKEQKTQYNSIAS